MARSSRSQIFGAKDNGQSSLNARARLWLAATLMLVPTLLAVSFCTAPAAAATSAELPSQSGQVFRNGVRQQDEVLLVNVRPLCGSCNADRMAKDLRVEEYSVVDEIGSRRWLSSSMDSWVDRDPTVKTVFFVHGNRVSSGYAKSRGLAVYKRMMHYGGDGPPIRFVIFSWPSTEVRGLLKDYRIKAMRTGPAGCQLAWVIDQLPAETPLSLFGYSYGARIVTGGLHILGGGRMSGRGLAERANPDRAPMRVVLMAAAVHAHWLGPGQYHGQALSQIDRILMLNNSRDPAMRFYRFTTKGGNPQGMGLRGPTRPGPEGWKIMNRNLSRYIGKSHDLFRYLNAPGVSAQFWDYLSFADVDPVSAN